jgi:serine acetyltransferase
VKEKLLSRKFFVVVATFVAAALKVLFDIEIDDSALVGAAAIVVTYLGGQSWVDKAKASNAVDFSVRNALAAAEAYARTLEDELAGAGQEAA